MSPVHPGSLLLVVVLAVGAIPPPRVLNLQDAYQHLPPSGPLRRLLVKSEQPEEGNAAGSLVVKDDLRVTPLKIAAFNIQVFGETKSGKAAVVHILKRILARYDLTLVQEIRDASSTYFPQLVDDLIKSGHPSLAYVISPRLGRTSSKEQYAYIYNKEHLRMVQTKTYSDPGDRFQREPFCALFQTTDSVGGQFGVIGIHTQPDNAPTEIDALVDVYDSATRWFRTKDIILMGDFNADCSYVTRKEWKSVRLKTDKRFTWHIGDDVDTTVKGTHCAYDRFVTAGPSMQDAVIPRSAKVFKFDDIYGLSSDEAEDVSDHYPIEMQLNGKALSSSPASLYPTLVLYIATFSLFLFHV